MNEDGLGILKKAVNIELTASLNSRGGFAFNR
ncbi:hypothetical protein MEZE111188_05045 [Mesobacillus zeae]